MEKAQFEKAVLSMVHNEGAERLTAANVAYKLGLSVKAAERQLDELVTEGGLELDSDDNGNLFYYVPGVSGGGVFSGVSGVNLDTSDAPGAHYPPKGHHPGNASPNAPAYGQSAPSPSGHDSHSTYGPGATPWGASYGPKPSNGPNGAPGASAPYGQPPGYGPQHPRSAHPQSPYPPQHGYPPQQPYAQPAPNPYAQPAYPPAPHQYAPHQQAPPYPGAPYSAAPHAAQPSYAPPHSPYGAPPRSSKGWQGYGSQAAPQHGYPPQHHAPQHHAPQHHAPAHHGPAPGAQYHSPSGYGQRRAHAYGPQYGHGTTAMVHQPPGHLRSPATAAILSSFPGAGQLYNGQVGKALAFFMLTMITYWVMFPLGILPHMWAAIDAKNTAKRLNYYGLLPP